MRTVGGNHPGGNFPGGSFHVTYKILLTRKHSKTARLKQEDRNAKN